MKKTPDAFSFDKSMDYDSLRREGIRQIERLGSRFWTDYNAHDPGITILEQLCYAITDLLYRIDYPIQDLLAEGGRDPFASLFRPSEILPSHPVTLQDLRKIAVNVDGVRNAWVERIEDISPLPQEVPVYYFDSEEKTLSLTKEDQVEPVVLKGIYQVSIEVEDTKDSDEKIIQNVTEQLHQNRNLGEDFLVKKLTEERIKINAEIEIIETANLQEVQKKIYNQIKDYFSPPVKFYSLHERIEAGEYIDELFEGPLLQPQRGFINSEEFEKTNKRRTELRASDLIRLLMDIEGVRLVRSLQFLSGEKWLVKLKNDVAPALDKNSKIRFFKGDVEIDNGKWLEGHAAQSAKNININNLSADDVSKFPSIASKDRKIGDSYYSIQHQFPDAYGINRSGLPASASSSRKAQAKQLKAYLLLFDQLLANQFSQLANLSRLFSFAKNDVCKPTYCCALLDDAELGLNNEKDEIDRIWTNSKQQDRIDNLEQLIENPEKEHDRQNRFLNHLLARFAEQFFDDHATIECKAKYLQKYASFSKERGKAINYLNPSAGADNRTGLEQQIMLRLGLSEHDSPPFYVIEHILLRPVCEDNYQKAPSLLCKVKRRDPYSLQVTVVLPEELKERKNVIREAMPAHLTTYFPDVDIELFKKAYCDWRKAMKDYYGHQKQNVSNSEKNKTSPCTDADGNEQNSNPFHYTLRSARDRIIDLLEIGKTYPLADTKLEYEKVVAHNSYGKITIICGQKDVEYELFKKDNSSLYKITDLSTITPEIKYDETYKILASKKNFFGMKIFIQQLIYVKVGLNLELKKEIINDNLIFFGDKITVRIYIPQAGVKYQLFDCSNDTDLSDEVARQAAQEESIDIQSRSGFIEDQEVYIKAVNAAVGKDDQLTKTLHVMVKPNTELHVAATPSSRLSKTDEMPIITINETQSTVNYQAYSHILSDEEFLFGSDHAEKTISVSVPDDPELVQVKQLAWEKIWKDIPGYDPITDSVQGNSGQLEIIANHLLKDDSVIIVKAEKKHDEKGNISAVQLREAVVFLVPPDRDAQLSLKPLIKDGKMYALEVSNGQTGVFYHFSLKEKNKEEICLPAYFHDKNKGIGKLRVGRDFVIAASEDYTDVVVDFYKEVAFTDDSKLYIRARKARTNVWVDLDPIKFSDISE